jgi:O-antigen ligase
MVIGTLTGIASAAVLISPRVDVIFLAVLTVLWWWQGLPSLRGALPKLDTVTICFGALLLYAAASSLWAAYPAAALSKVLLLALLVFVARTTAGVIAAQGRPEVLRPAEGLWIGYVIGLAFYFVEAVTAEAVKLWLINSLHVDPELVAPAASLEWLDGLVVSINDKGLTRAATPITILFWPALMAALGAIARPWNRRFFVLIFILAIATVLASPQESSKVAIACGLAVFGLAWLSSRWALRVVAIAWVAACLAVLPAVLAIHRLDLQNAAWLQGTARHRLVIWNFTAEQTLKAPVLGIGAYMTYLTGLDITAKTAREQDANFEKSLSRHSHNVYLQTWFELGVVGALLLACAGVALLRRIGQLAAPVQPYALATFSSAATLLASSYGIWQTWYMALFALAPILLAVGARAWETSAPGGAGWAH